MYQPMHRGNSLLSILTVLQLTCVHDIAPKPVQATGCYLVEGRKAFDHGNSPKGSW